jgi:hypothetical protein
MARTTIQAARARLGRPGARLERLRARPLGLLGGALVAVEALVAAVAGGAGPLAAAALLLAPGMALVPVLPACARRDLVTALAATPVLGFAASAIGLITLSAVGVELGEVAVRLVPAAVVVVGLALGGREPPLRAGAREGLVAAGLAGAVLVGIVLAERVLGGFPVPGNDWAKYVLYADEIRRHGALLIDNPFWMLGVPFREDPATPAVYGAYLVMTGQPAAVLAHGIWVFAVAAVLAVFALVRALWGAPAGLVAAALWAALPISQDILGWHGLPNQAALALLLLVLLYAGTAFAGDLEWRAVVGFGLLLAGLAATHRLSLLIGLGGLALALGAAFVLGDLRRVLRPVLGAGLVALGLGAGVLYDLVQRQRTFGGTLSYADYLPTKFAVGATARSLTYVFTAVALVGVVLAVRHARRDRALVPLLALLAFALACAYAWVVELPMAYVRMAYYLPLALVPLAAVALARLPRARHTLAAGAALAAVVAAFAWSSGSDVRRFYSFVDAGSLAGLDAVAADLRDGEVVVTDRCWSFLATWLLHTRTLPALFPADIQPRAELERAEQAQAILAGEPAGLELARRLGVRYVLVDPTCPSPEGRPLDPPQVGEPAFISERLVVLRL